MIINMTGSGGSGKLFAAISVTYPEGSVCTCSDGVKTLTAKNTSGLYLFSIPYAATWIVTATDGTETATKTVEIISEGQSISIELTYGMWLYKTGDQYVSLTGGWSASGYSGPHTNNGSVGDSIICKSICANDDQGGIVGTVNKIDLTEYNTLKATGNLNQYKNTSLFLIGLNTTKKVTGAGLTVDINITEAGTFEVTIDISSIAEPMYVVVAAIRNGDDTSNYTCILEVSDIMVS